MRPIVVNEQTGEVLYEKNADKREYPASMTKMMTCILALERTSPDQIVTVSDNAADVECTRLYPGYELRMADIGQQSLFDGARHGQNRGLRHEDAGFPQDCRH
jgi:D-alanyl-D-alanine carboxypeptidase (penicillin-binding protein 5/6)